MKHLLFIITVLFGSTCWGAVQHTVTICASGCDYTTLAAAEAAWDVDLVTKDTNITMSISGTWSDQTTVTFDGAVTDATRNITVTTTGSARHSGIWDGTNAYRIVETSGANRCIVVSDNYITIDGLQVKNTGSGQVGILIAGPSNVVIKNNIAVGNGEAGTSASGVHFTTGAGNEAWNNIAYDWGTRGIHGDATSDAVPTLIYNNTIVDCKNGLTYGYQLSKVRNNVIFSCPTLPISAGGSGTNSDHNATDAASIAYGDCTVCGTGDLLSIVDPFVNAAGDDFRLAGGISEPVEGGKDLSATVTGDIQGDTRPDGNWWDIGADENIDAEVEQLEPDGESFPTGWTYFGSTATPQEAVDQNNDTTGISTGTFDKNHGFTLKNTTEIGGTDVVDSLTVTYRADHNHLDFPPPSDSIRVELIVGTDTLFGADTKISNTLANYSEKFTTAPDLGAWTITDVNALKLNMRVLVGIVPDKYRVTRLFAVAHFHAVGGAAVLTHAKRTKIITGDIVP